MALLLEYFIPNTPTGKNVCTKTKRKKKWMHANEHAIDTPFNIQTRQQSMPNLCYAIFQYVHILKVMKTDIVGLELPKYVLRQYFKLYNRIYSSFPGLAKQEIVKFCFCFFLGSLALYEKLPSRQNLPYDASYSFIIC